MTANGLADAAEIVPAGTAALASTARDQLDRIKRHWHEFWFEVSDFYHHERWVPLGYGSALHCAKVELGLSKQRFHQILDAADVVARIRSQKLLTSDTPLPANDHQARALVPLKEEPEKMAAAWQEAVETAPRDASGAAQVTAARVSAVVDRFISGGAAVLPRTGASGGSGALDPAAQLLALRREMDRHLGTLHDLREAFGARLQADDLTSHELTSLASALKRLAGATEALAAVRTRATRERTARGGVRVRRRPLSQGPLVVQRVAAAVAAQPGSTSHDVAAATGIKLSTVSGRLSGLLRAGRVSRSPEQPFRYTSIPREATP